MTAERRASIDLLDRRVLFVTGKGGVGKTTVSCALALSAARRGKRVLLVETGPKENLSFLFGTGPIGYEPVEVYPGVRALHLDPYEALTEFLTHEIRIRMIARSFVRNRVFRYLAEVAPGWRELITLGKIWVEEGRLDPKTRSPRHDLVIVDAPATGHGIGLLRVPRVLLDTLSFGPIKHYTARVEDLLEDPRRTAVVVVTLAEEMPVNETAELVATARETVRVPLGVVFANGVYPEVFPRGTKGTAQAFIADPDAVARLDRALGPGLDAGDVIRCARSLAERYELNRRYLKLLAERVSLPILVLPYLFTEQFDVRDLEELSREVDRALEDGQ